MDSNGALTRAVMINRVLAASLVGTLLWHGRLVMALFQAAPWSMLGVALILLLVLLMGSVIGLLRLSARGYYFVYILVPYATMFHGIALIPGVTNVLPTPTLRLASVLLLNLAFLAATIVSHRLVRQGRPNGPGPVLTRRATLILVTLFVSGACDSLSPMGCTTEFVYGVSAEVFHSGTGLPVTDESLAGTLHEGDYSEIMGRSGNRLGGAGEREGTYSMRVTADGFEPWSRTDIRVEADACHVIPVGIEVRLEPSEST